MTASPLVPPSGRRLVQPDRRSCGASVAVAVRMLQDPAYAARLAGPSAGPRAFADEVLAVHRRLTAPRDAHGAAQLPWPRALGTPPWALARHLGDDRVRVRTRPVLPWARAAALEGIRSAAAGSPVPLYVGSRWLPRHVVLVLDADLATWDPASGRVVTLSADDFTRARLGAVGWPRPWCWLEPVPRDRAGTGPRPRPRE